MSAPEFPKFANDEINYQPPVAYEPAVAAQGNSALSIVGLVFSIFLSLIGILISGIAWYTGKKEGRKTTVAKVGFFLGLFFFILTIGFYVYIFNTVDLSSYGVNLGNP